MQQGIYPRVPPNDVKKKNKTHYHKKDIMFLMHDPIISQIRKYKTFRRKLRKFYVRHEKSRAESLKSQRPDFNFDHMIKERYPTFVEALRDLDDALSMVFLFATLPQNRFLRDHVIERCARLSSEWMSYAIRARCLRKVFCSIKGVYFQASVLGEVISWLVPYPYTPNVPENVDFKVMLTFLEFHMKHLEFVLFRLYSQLGLSYPPVVNQALARNGATILAYQFKEIGAATVATASRNADDEDDEDDDDEEKGEGEVVNEEQARALEAEVHKIETQLKSAGMDTAAFGEDEPEDELAAQNEQLDKAGDEFRQLARLEGQADGVAELDPLPTLFRGLVFFLGRENLRDILYVTLAACGATVGWEGPDSPFDLSSAAITHVVCDRPSVADPRADVEYVQPQWVFDSVNFAFLLPVSEYAPGRGLPPHLSPFVNDEQEGYVPERKQQILRFIEQSKQGLAPPASWTTVMPRSCSRRAWPPRRAVLARKRRSRAPRSAAASARRPRPRRRRRKRRCRPAQ